MFPIFIENSKIPVWLSKIPFVPIEIGAITLGPVVISRSEMSITTRRHEAIHWAQYIECAVVFFPILYFAFWIKNRIKGIAGAQAYYEIPFEKEAYANQEDPDYLLNRKLFAWARR